MSVDPLIPGFLARDLAVRPHYLRDTSIAPGWQVLAHGCELAWRCDDKRVGIAVLRRRQARSGLANPFAALYLLAEATLNTLGPRQRFYGKVLTLAGSPLPGKRMARFYRRWTDATEPADGGFELEAGRVAVQRGLQKRQKPDRAWQAPATPIPTMGDMNECAEDTLRTTVQAAELTTCDSEECDCLLAEMWQGLGLATDAGELLFLAPKRELTRAAEEELLTELRRIRSSQPTQGEQGTGPRRPTSMHGLLIGGIAMEVRSFNAAHELFLDEPLTAPAAPTSTGQEELLALLRSERIVLAHAG